MARKLNKRRHAFRFKIPAGEGKPDNEITIWAKVRNATKPVAITLTAAHVWKAIDARGYGNTQTCAMAQCVKDQSSRFPHQIDGYVDWEYTRAYVVSKLDKNGVPSECVVYVHSDKIAQFFDKNADSNALLDLVQELERDGPRQISLRPPKPRTDVNRSHRAKGVHTGERKKYQPKGAALRFAVASLALEKKAG